jgi:hypothetical protein
MPSSKKDSNTFSGFSTVPYIERSGTAYNGFGSHNLLFSNALDEALTKKFPDDSNTNKDREKYVGSVMLSYKYFYKLYSGDLFEISLVDGKENTFCKTKQSKLSADSEYEPLENPNELEQGLYWKDNLYNIIDNVLKIIMKFLENKRKCLKELDSILKVVGTDMSVAGGFFYDFFSQINAENTNTSTYSKHYTHLVDFIVDNILDTFNENGFFKSFISLFFKNKNSKVKKDYEKDLAKLPELASWTAKKTLKPRLQRVGGYKTLFNEKMLIKIFTALEPISVKTDEFSGFGNTVKGKKKKKQKKSIKKKQKRSNSTRRSGKRNSTRRSGKRNSTRRSGKRNSTRRSGKRN